MSDDRAFEELVRRVRAGEQAAAAELVRQYEPEIRRDIRVRLTDPAMRRVLDSVDICQSVLGNFFVRVALGQFDLQSPDDLTRLLVTMARNKLSDWKRRQHAQRRDVRRVESLHEMRDTEPLATEPSPSRLVAGADLLHQFRSRLSNDERQIADRRAEGIAWEQIAHELGSSAEALRKRLTRALDRVAGELHLEELGL